MRKDISMIQFPKLHGVSIAVGALCTLLLVMSTGVLRPSRKLSGVVEKTVEHLKHMHPRVYHEHVDELRVEGPYHVANKHNWSDVGYSRPFVLGERLAPCSVAEATSKNKLAVDAVRAIYDSFGGFPGNFSAARAMFAEASQLDPTCIAPVMSELMLTLQEMGLHAGKDVSLLQSRAKILMDKSLELGPNMARVHLWHAIYTEYLGQGNDEQMANAVKYYQKAIDIDPEIKSEHFHPKRFDTLTLFGNWYNTTVCTALSHTFIQLLSFYEFAPALGAYGKITFEDTQKFLSAWKAQIPKFLPDYVIAMFADVYEALVKSMLLKHKENTKSATHESNGDMVNTWMNVRIAEFITRLSGYGVVPTYGYTAGYDAGDVLSPHTDRNMCEFTLTINLLAIPHASSCPLMVQHRPWKIDDLSWTGRWEEETYERDGIDKLVPQIGDLLVLRGRAMPHFRPAVPAGGHCLNFLSHFTVTRHAVLPPGK